MNGIIIGRYQPVHNGHVEMLKCVDELGLEKILLGIGYQVNGIDKKNPFTTKEIIEMWQPEIAKLKTPTEIYLIPDINNPPKYAKHVEKITSCNEKETLMISGNAYTIDCFTKHGKNYQIYTVPPQITMKEGRLSATVIRDWMSTDGPWREYVPQSTMQVIERIDGVKRIKELYQDQEMKIQ